MYITDTTNNVKEIFEKLEELNDKGRLRFLLYTYGLLNNDQINSKNEINPNLVEDNELIILNMKSLNFPDNYCTVFLQYLVVVNNIINEANQIYEDNGNVIGIDYSEEDKMIISLFEKLCFEEKLDVFSELFIRYDNETYFSRKITMLSWSDDVTGFDIARLIQTIKKEIK